LTKEAINNILLPGGIIMELIREIREIDSDRIVIKVPLEFKKKMVEILVFPLDLFKAEGDPADKPGQEKTSASGLCGIWEDDRTPDEIIDDIHSSRTGFGNRQIEL
jgi:hypothetical protein